MVRIAVPKPPKSAYNPDRKAGALLLAQLKHLEWAVRPAAERRPGMIDLSPELTEAEVAARIEQLTIDLHHQTIGREPVIPPPRRKPRRRKRKPRRSK